MLDKRQQQILAVRNQVMKNRKVLCTGNPDREGTIASAVKKIWPETTFIHLSNGFDLKNISSVEDKLKKSFQTHNTFINASYLGGMQIKLLELCHQHMPIGEVYNIGSTNEYDGLGSETYKNNKTIYGPETKSSTRHINMCMHWTNNPNDEVDPAFVSLTAD